MVFGYDQNHCSAVTGISVRQKPELVFAFHQNRCSAETGIYTQLSFLHQLDFSYVDTLIDNTNQLMRDTGISNQKINETNNIWNMLCARKYIAKLIPHSQLTDDGKNNYSDIFDFKNITFNNEYIEKIVGFLRNYFPNYDNGIFSKFKEFIITMDRSDKEYLK